MFYFFRKFGMWLDGALMKALYFVFTKQLMLLTGKETFYFHLTSTVTPMKTFSNILKIVIASKNITCIQLDVTFSIYPRR